MDVKAKSRIKRVAKNGCKQIVKDVVHCRESLNILPAFGRKFNWFYVGK